MYSPGATLRHRLKAPNAPVLRLGASTRLLPVLTWTSEPGGQCNLDLPAVAPAGCQSLADRVDLAIAVGLGKVAHFR